MDAKFEEEPDPLENTGELPDIFIEDETPVIEQLSLAEQAIIRLRSARATLWAALPGTIEQADAEIDVKYAEQKFESLRDRKAIEAEISDSEIMYHKVGQFMGRLFRFGRR
jgi:hypothetical protein